MHRSRPPIPGSHSQPPTASPTAGTCSRSGRPSRPCAAGRRRRTSRPRTCGTRSPCGGGTTIRRRSRQTGRPCSPSKPPTPSPTA
eukprot:3528057-Pyramimonas_sp.AAC.3